jgi:hypothetical protein
MTKEERIRTRQLNLTETPEARIERVMNQRMRVLDAMPLGVPLTTNDVAGRSGLNRNRTYNALRALAKDGAIICAHRGDIAPQRSELDELPLWMRV